MSFQRIICEVIFTAWRHELNGEGLPTGKIKPIGEYETKREAEQALADNGFTRKEWGWNGNYEHGSVSRVLREIDSGRA